MMLKIKILIVMACCAMLVAMLDGCEKRSTDRDVSYPDAAKMFISESNQGTGVYGSDIVLPVSERDLFSAVSSDSLTWIADWDFYPHGFSDVIIDTGTFRFVPGFRIADMTFRDTVNVTVRFTLDDNSEVEKYNIASGVTGASLVQLGNFGDAYHGFSLRTFAHRKLNGKVSGSPNILHVTVVRPGGSSNITTSESELDAVLLFARGDSITVYATTNDANNRLFLNYSDSGDLRRREMSYDSFNLRFTGGWRVSFAATSRSYHQAFIEAYGPRTFTTVDSGTVYASGHSIVYRIE